MPVPTGYTEAEFKSFLIRALADMATALGWDTSTEALTEVGYDTLIALGMSDFDEVGAEDVAALRAAGRFHLWDAVCATVAGDYQFSADGASFSRDQLKAHAEAERDRWRAELAAYGLDPAYRAEVVALTYRNDPYADYEDS